MALERPLVSILNLCIQWVGDQRYPNIHRRSSVRTDCLPSRSPPRRGTTVEAGKSHQGSQHHLTRNACWPARKLVVAARVVRASLLQLEIITQAHECDRRDLAKYMRGLAQKYFFLAKHLPVRLADCRCRTPAQNLHLGQPRLGAGRALPPCT